MLRNVEPRATLNGLSRAKARSYVTATVHPLLVGDELEKGWKVDKKNSKSVRLRRPKPDWMAWEDRVWTLLYRMGFTHLSGQGGGLLDLNTKEEKSPTSQIDVVGLDDEVAIVISCKSAEKYSKRSGFREELAVHNELRQRFTNCIRQQFQAKDKRQVAFAMFLRNADLSDNDKKWASESRIILFDDRDLTYYEDLVAHLGQAARYQFLADILPEKEIPGLSIKVPAVRTKVGGYNCYTFSVAPADLLKVAFVAHRVRGNQSQIHTYQRMMRKSRLRAIRDFIEEDGIFPTNIVLSLQRAPEFERSQQLGDQNNGVFGWLRLKPLYRSAWIIDGQHRLYAYSGLEQALTSRLVVLAFERLPPSKQAELFISINAEQRKVKQSHLQELYADLRWESPDLEERLSAIVSKAVQALDEKPNSPFFDRILKADEKRSNISCITLGSVTKAISEDFFVLHRKKDVVGRYGPLWNLDGMDATYHRTIFVLDYWFGVIRNAVPDWWDLGIGEGGGVATSNGISVCLKVLRSVFQHLDATGYKLAELTDDELIACIQKYATALGDYFTSMSDQDRRVFRSSSLGDQGQIVCSRRCQVAMREALPTFSPSGLDDFIRLEKAQTNTKAKEIIDRIERTLQRTIVEELRREFGNDESEWWLIGVPKNVRLKVGNRHEDDDGRRGGREYYFDLIDYRAIAQEHWSQFEPLLAQGKSNISKDKRTAWMIEVNDMRKVVSHATAGKHISVEQLA